ncbi:MAG: aminomethyl-transferring glycine dehydrogenase [Leptolyngbya sp. SIO3F4]|nr:aminomethyl-transferring glycine dehydrogenase [Leptolyngbya sp. SIO3F4]
MAYNSFTNRHIGASQEEVREMLETVGVSSVEELIAQTIPANIRLNGKLNLPEAMTEFEFAHHIEELAAKNEVFQSYIGMGYHATIVPPVIRRNVLENPGWYTAYTPYQAEIAQGRLEALLNFQTAVIDFTGLEMANASLLDEGTAAAEAMFMFYNLRSRQAQKAGVNKFFVSDECFPQTIEVLKTRAHYLDIEVVIGSWTQIDWKDGYFGALVQNPTLQGTIHDYTAFIEEAHTNDAKVCVAVDLMALAVSKSPGSMGADCAVGNSQRFGVPMGYGGPHAAFFATREAYKRHVPGRIIGVSKDADDNPAYRMALQTREQHIRRDKATSNICTAQALLAVMASFYAVYHGPEGMRGIAETIHFRTGKLQKALKDAGYNARNTSFFDTISFEADANLLASIREKAEAARINLRYDVDGFGISLNETTSEADVTRLAEVLAAAKDTTASVVAEYAAWNIPSNLQRSVDYLQHPIFNRYRSETDMMRYIKKLENRDISLMHSMISLGSCTMKLNAASELYPISHPAFASLHPFVPVEQAQGYTEMIEQLNGYLCEITGFDALSFQPNSGAQGEYTGLLVIRDYQEARGEGHRNICLIPSSAHGTNPASAVMAGMRVVVVSCDEAGNIEVDDLRKKAEEHKDNLAALMITYPSTHGVFEEAVVEIINIVHERGGQVYMDGANMNAQVGLTSPGFIGADVCHLNLHKTFAIPHGGGGPGMGPIGVKQHLAPFLPKHELIATGGDQAVHSVSSAPFGSALILLISYAYIRLLGNEGVTESTRIAILNANYLKARLMEHYPVLYRGVHGHIAHEMILDCREFKRTAGIEVEDIAKRLIDYGFHAPTVSFPVAGTVMIEPTESESKNELDRFADAMIGIRQEIAEIESGAVPTINNVLKNAPHTAQMVMRDAWEVPYSREKAVFPAPYLLDSKFWPHVRRVDNAYGDRNLVCSCLPIEEYAEEVV